MLKKMVMASALALMASSAFAAAPGSFYAGLDVGSTSLDRADGHPTSVGGFLGYNFATHWAVEGAVRDFGKFDVNGGDISVSQASVSLIGTLPVGMHFDLFASVGYNHLNVDNNSRFVTLDDNPSGGNLAIGVAYHFTPTIAGRLQFQQAATDLSNASAGIVFQF